MLRRDHRRGKARPARHRVRRHAARAYLSPKWYCLDCSDDKESTSGDDKKSKNQCYTEMREAAQKELDNGCDLQDVTLKVNFINCADTEEYRQTPPFLFDGVCQRSEDPSRNSVLPMTVISGCKRLNVTVERGYTEMPCAVADIDKTREKVLNIALHFIPVSAVLQARQRNHFVRSVRHIFRPR